MLLLSDPEHTVIDRYGILNPESNGLPHPATYVIDKEGIVRWKFLEVDYRIRPTNEQVLEALKVWFASKLNQVPSLPKVVSL